MHQPFKSCPVPGAEAESELTANGRS